MLVRLETMDELLEARRDAVEQARKWRERAADDHSLSQVFAKYAAKSDEYAALLSSHIEARARGEAA